MGNEVGNNKFTWVIKNFSSLQQEKIYSEEFVIDGCKWRLLAFPKGNSDLNADNNLSLYLAVADAKYLHFGWKRQAKNGKDRGCTPIINLAELMSENGGFMVNGEVKIVAEVEVLNVIGELDVSEETQPRKKMKLEETSAEWVDVNGFQVLPSQVEFVSCVVKKYPDIALQLRAKNGPLRSSCLYVFLGLIEILCKSLDELSDDNLLEADRSLNFLKCSGIKVSWFEKKLEEVKENKKEEQIGVARTLEFKETLKIFKQKCSNVETLLEKNKEELKGLKQNCSVIEARLEKEEAKLLVTRAPPVTLD